MDPKKKETIKAFLSTLYSDTGNERCGFIMPSTLVEVANVHLNPTEGFDISADDIVRWGNECVATWHTHPGATSNLSEDDYSCFVKQWPELHHFIVGSDGVKCYKFDQQKSALMEI